MNALNSEVKKVKVQGHDGITCAENSTLWAEPGGIRVQSFQYYQMSWSMLVEFGVLFNVGSVVSVCGRMLSVVCVFVLCTGEHLRVCPQGRLTCCTADMENKLVARSRTELQQRLSRTLDQHRRTFADQTDTFNSTTPSLCIQLETALSRNSLFYENFCLP